LSYGHRRHINILRGKNVELIKVKLGGKLTTGPYLVHNEVHATDWPRAYFAVSLAFLRHIGTN